MNPPQDGRLTKIAVFVSFSGKGGVERMIVNLCRGLRDQGCMIDLLLVKSRSVHLTSIPDRINVKHFKASHTFGSLFELAAYMRRAKPHAVLAAKDRAGQTAILARRLSNSSCRLVIRIGTTVSAALEGRRAYRKWLWYLPMRLLYPRADAVVAVSDGVARDLARITRMPYEAFHVIPNPVITVDLALQASKMVVHPWFNGSDIPVILAVGRLTRQKDFPTLLRAFAGVRAQKPCRLMILGEGRDRSLLEKLIDDLELKGSVEMPGYLANPYRYLARCALFVLSSAWEGSPNVLTEALALGVPAVATDCPSGPREILGRGRYGRLVPVGDVEAMTAAILATLADRPAADFLKAAVREYTAEASSRRYLEVLSGKTS